MSAPWGIALLGRWDADGELAFSGRWSGRGHEGKDGGNRVWE